MTAERSTPAPSRTTDARRDELARHIADLILHAISHCGDGVQVYADMIDGREVALRAAQHLYAEASDVLLSLRPTCDGPTALAALISAQVGSISPASVRERWRSADALRQADDEAERLYGMAVEADRTAQRQAARTIKALAASTPGAGPLRGFGDEDAAAVRHDEDAASHPAR